MHCVVKQICHIAPAGSGVSADSFYHFFKCAPHRLRDQFVRVSPKVKNATLDRVLVPRPQIRREKMATRMERHGVFHGEQAIGVARGPRVHMPGLADQSHDRFIVRTIRIGKAEHRLAEKLLQPVATFHNVAPRCLDCLLIEVGMCQAVVGDCKAFIDLPHVIPSQPFDLRALVNPAKLALFFVQACVEVEGGLGAVASDRKSVV